MSEFNVQKYALMCRRLAAECSDLAANVPEPDLRAHFLRKQAYGRNWRISPVS